MAKITVSALNASPTITKTKPVHLRKASKQAEMSATLRKLHSFLDANELKMMYFLVNLWHT